MTEDNKEKRLVDLVARSKDVVREAFRKFRRDELAITWTGGKDSTTTLWVIRQVCQEDGIPIPRVMTIDEGDAFPEIHDFMTAWAKAWKLDLEWCINQDVINAAGGKLTALVRVKDLNERNRAEVARIGYDKEEFPFEAESYVGNHLMKTVVFNEYIERRAVKGIFQGLRRDEQAARKEDEYFEQREAAPLVPAHTRIKPILHFMERDIWDTIMFFKIPYCVLYEQGFRSLGAASTSLIALEGVPAWKQDLEHTQERAGRRQDKEKIMDRLRKLGYM
ncbi:MAG: phosphoadenosine phosphosulfate reductase family protein [Candidatus Aminicenantes bacterium]|nr:phosphoadenosine phosphosulfate reductase family protein [Candidatus Aminicenantes bacterium]